MIGRLRSRINLRYINLKKYSLEISKCTFPVKLRSRYVNLVVVYVSYSYDYFYFPTEHGSVGERVLVRRRSSCFASTWPAVVGPWTGYPVTITHIYGHTIYTNNNNTRRRRASRARNKSIPFTRLIESSFSIMRCAICRIHGGGGGGRCTITQRRYIDPRVCWKKPVGFVSRAVRRRCRSRRNPIRIRFHTHTYTHTYAYTTVTVTVDAPFSVYETGRARARARVYYIELTFRERVASRRAQ